MLSNHPKLQPALVRCHEEPTLRVVTRDDGTQFQTGSRFSAIVDEHGDELGHVSARFRIVQTTDVVSAFDLAGERAGMAFEPREAFYQNGLAKFTLDAPGLAVPDDRDGGLMPRLIVMHGLGGRGGLRVYGGLDISVCSNGMVVGKMLDVSYARHTTGIDVWAQAERAVRKLTDHAEASRLVVAQARAARASDELVRKILAAAPKRHAKTFQGVVDRNLRTYGQTGWALVQAVTELATHHMRERRDGSHVWSADEWSRARTADVLEAVGVSK